MVESCDPVNNFENVKQIYQHVDPTYDGEFKLPILFDKISNTIVNNETSEIIQMLNNNFYDLA